MECSVDEDARLAAAARDDPAAFKPVYDKWLPRVYRYFYFRVGNEKDAEDLTSQVFLQVCEALPRYRISARFSTWLFTIAHSRVVDFYRKKRPEIDLDKITQLPSPGNMAVDVDRQEEFDRVTGLLRTCTDEEQELIRLRFFADLNYAEIGVVLHKREDAVRKATTRLIQRLQAQTEVDYD
jgi:RNA polymerase sigma-70 factor (ECF subfamily)